MKNVLVLSYYFPPLGLSGVQRTTKFVKYLPEFGWKPTVLAARPGSYFAFDESLLDDIPDSVDVHRTRSLDPTRWLGRRKTTSIPSVSKHGRLRELSNRLFFPDNKNLWLPFARREANTILRQNKIDVIFSTAPPFSSHLLAIELGTKLDIPVVVDFRDNWVGNPRKVYASSTQRERHEKAEADVFRRSDHVVTINDYIREDFTRRTGVPPSKVSVIEQGYDPDDLADLPGTGQASTRREEITFGYSGIFYDAQKPDSFLHAFAQARDMSKIVRDTTKSVFTGLVPDYFSDLVGQLGLADVVRYNGYLPHHESLKTLSECDIPWMVVGNQPGGEQISTGKLGEYIGLRKPILGLVPRGAARDTLQSYGASNIYDPDDIDGIASGIVGLVNSARDGTLPDVNEACVVRHDRRVLTENLTAIFNRCVL